MQWFLTIVTFVTTIFARLAVDVRLIVLIVMSAFQLNYNGKRMQTYSPKFRHMHQCSVAREKSANCAVI